MGKRMCKAHVFGAAFNTSAVCSCLYSRQGRRCIVVLPCMLISAEPELCRYLVIMAQFDVTFQT